MGTLFSTTQYKCSRDTRLSASEDLQTEILLRLPVKSIIRFKCVSTRWLSLISTPYFSSAHTRLNPYPTPSGMFFYASGYTTPKFVTFDIQNPAPPSRSFAFLNDPGIIKVMQSCNGLVLCSSSPQYCHPITRYYICNPVTGQFKLIPCLLQSANKELVTVNLAYDPLKMPEFRLVRVCMFKKLLPEHNYCNEDTGYDVNVYQMETYLPSSGCWKPSGDPFVDPLFKKDDFKHGVLWNDSIYWLSKVLERCLYFDLEKGGQFKEMKMPPAQEIPSLLRRFKYFGESNGHLHLITQQLDVYEMENDHGGWLFKYRLRLKDLPIDFSNIVCDTFKVLTVIQGDKEDLCLVISVLGEIISYNLKDKSSKTLLNSTNKMVSQLWQCCKCNNYHQCVETLSHV